MYYAVCVYKRCICRVVCTTKDQDLHYSIITPRCAYNKKTCVIKLLSPSVCTIKDVNMSSCVHDK